MFNWLAQHPKNSLLMQLVAVLLILLPIAVWPDNVRPVHFYALGVNALMVVIHIIRWVKFSRDTNKKRTPVLPES